MSYNIYNTEGIVLSSFDIGESNKFFKIFTRELGLVNATAQSVRKIKSKNRYGLQDFSISDISLVRGRDIWRITNVIPKENLFFFFTRRRPTSAGGKFNSLVEVFSLLQQLIHGEEQNEELFDLVIGAVDFLKKVDLDQIELENFVLITKMRILYNLGHFDKEGFLEFLDNNDFDKKIIKKVGLGEKKIQKTLDKVMEEMQN